MLVWCVHVYDSIVYLLALVLCKINYFVDLFISDGKHRNVKLAAVPGIRIFLMVVLLRKKIRNLISCFFLFWFVAGMYEKL